MSNVHSRGVSAQPQLAAAAKIFAPAPWPLLRLLPARVGSIPPELARQLGAAIDAGQARLVLTDAGDAVATRRSAR